MEQEIKDCWRSARFNSDNDNMPPNRKTALQCLIERYKRFSRFALIFACCIPLCISNLLRHDVSAPVWQQISLIVFTMAYCFTASVMDCWMARGLSSIKLAEMPVAEVCRRAFFYRKKHFQFMAVLIPMCLVLLGLLGWLLSNNQYALYGMACGAVLGGTIGFRVFSRFMKEYRELTSDE